MIIMAMPDTPNPPVLMTCAFCGHKWYCFSERKFILCSMCNTMQRNPFSPFNKDFDFSKYPDEKKKFKRDDANARR
jgi:hypothetical protein